MVEAHRIVLPSEAKRAGCGHGSGSSAPVFGFRECYGRVILQVVGCTVSFASTRLSVLKPLPVRSTSYFTSLPSTLLYVEMYSGCTSWWLSARMVTSPAGPAIFMPSSALATFAGSADFA